MAGFLKLRHFLSTYLLTYTPAKPPPNYRQMGVTAIISPWVDQSYSSSSSSPWRPFASPFPAKGVVHHYIGIGSL